jgi:flagellar basal-body rod protein FlgF
MDNALLVGLSRQVALRRELDVIANNIANLNTTGFKGESVMFEQYLDPTATTAGSPSCWIARPCRISARGRCSGPKRRSTSRSTAPASSRCRRRTASAIPAPATSTSIRKGSSSPTTASLCSVTAARSCSSRPTPTSQSPPTAPCPRTTPKARSANAASCANPNQLSAQGDSLWSAPATMAPQLAQPTTRAIQGALEKSNVQAVKEMNRLLEVTRAYTSISNMQQRTDELRRRAIEKLAEV